MKKYDSSKWLNPDTLLLLAFFGGILIEIFFMLRENLAMTSDAQFENFKWSCYVIFVWWFVCLFGNNRELHTNWRGVRNIIRRIKYVMAYVLLAFALLVGSKFAFAFIGIPAHYIFTVLVEQHRLQHNTDHESLAKACQEVMSNWQYYEDLPWDDPAFPIEVRKVRPNYISISEYGVTMEMHGGFDHYGFRFRQQADESWELEYYTESSKNVLVRHKRFYEGDFRYLANVTRPINQCLAMDCFVRNRNSRKENCLSKNAALRPCRGQSGWAQSGAIILNTPEPCFYRGCG